MGKRPMNNNNAQKLYIGDHYIYIIIILNLMNRDSMNNDYNYECLECNWEGNNGYEHQLGTGHVVRRRKPYDLS